MYQKNVQKIDWEPFIGRGLHPILLLESDYFGLAKYLKEVTGLSFNMQFWRRDKETSYLSQREHQKILRSIEKLLAKRQKIFNSWLKDNIGRNQELINFTRQISERRLRNESDAQIEKWLKFFFRKSNEVWAYLFIPFFVEEIVTKKLKHFLKENLKGNQAQAEETVLLLTKSERKTKLDLEKEEKLKLAKKIFQNKKLRKLFLENSPQKIIKGLKNSKILEQINSHCQKYIWRDTYLMTYKKLSPFALLRELKELIRKNPLKILKQIQSEKRKIKKVQKEILIKMSKKIRYWVKLGQDALYFRNRRIEDSSIFYFYAHSLLDEWGRRHNLLYNDVIWLTQEEILNEKFNRKEIQKRKKDYILEMKEGKWNLYAGKEIKKYNLKIKDITKKEIKGVVANPGIAYGRVRIATPYTFPLLKKGEILVTNMTTPQAVPYLKKIKAIVTNEGGFTCHAAIVSRELGIPCIIGTKIATKVLKDGDLVEVDAEKGIIKVIKK